MWPVVAAPRLSNRKHAADLPASDRALYALTRLNDAVFDAAMADGKITLNTTEADVRRLKKAGEAEAAKTEAKD